jgi:hypothetical protein
MAIVSANGAATPLSPNYIINGAFDIWQRGTSFSNPNDSTYNADRWRIQHDGSGATRTITQQNFTPGSFPATGYQGSTFLRYAISAAGTSNTYQQIENIIEDIRTAAGQTVTLSFWAKADAARTLNLIWRREWNNYASADQTAIGSQISLTTSWARYSVTFIVPSISGLTIGSNSVARIIFRMAAATVQAVDFWGVQLEDGSIATPFRRNANSIQAELAACQRYFERVGQISNGNGSILGTGIGISSTQVRCTIRSSVPKRVGPTVTYNAGSAVRLWDGTNLTGTVTGMTQYSQATTSNGDCLVDFTTSSVTQYRPYFIIPANDFTGTFDLSAEL